MKAGRAGIRGRGIHKRGLQALLLAIAFAFALPAFALGLGRIVVKSAPGQPLLAEIPVVTADPSELGNLEVRLASSETFRRVGLPAPDAATANLQFAVAVDGRGQPVIRVTSAAPLRQPLLTFLIEVDWGAGRLVREYSVLLEAPGSLAAPAQPIQAPTVAAPNTIVREPEAAPLPPAPAPAEVAPAPVAAAAPVPAEPTPAVPVPAAPVPAAPAPAAAAPIEPSSPPAEVPSAEPAMTEADAGIVPEPLPEPAPEPETPSPSTSNPAPAAPTAIATATAYTVRAGDTLSGIAGGLDRGAHSLDQLMLALLQANPEAFIDGNINLIRQGAVLRAPSNEVLARYSAGDAAALVREQVVQWRQAAAARLPDNAAAIEGAAPAPAAGTANDERSTAGTTNPQGARLQIVPSASGKDAGTQSGTQAGGEGRMLRQEIQESRETIAARDAEVGELKTRVAELEKIQQQQQQLIAMKDTALAEARTNLAKAQQAVQAPKPANQAAAHDTVVWPWLAIAVLLAAAGGWWWWNRRDGEARTRPFTVPRAPRSRAAPVPFAHAEAAPPVVPSFAAPATPAPSMPPAASGPPAPEPVATPAPVAAVPSSPAAPAVPDWTAAPALVGTAPPASSGPLPPEENASPARQVELARAYLDLGDEPAARELLGEAMNGRDPVARDIAARMLRELG